MRKDNSRKRKSPRKITHREFIERRLEVMQQRQAENRRKLLAGMDQKTRDFTVAEFAKLGLDQ